MLIRQHLPTYQKKIPSLDPTTITHNDAMSCHHYAKLSRAMQATWVDRFLNNEIYC